jgi:hypothetical protein
VLSRIAPLARVTFFFLELVHGALFLNGDSFQNLLKWDRKQSRFWNKINILFDLVREVIFNELLDLFLSQLL